MPGYPYNPPESIRIVSPSDAMSSENWADVAGATIRDGGLVAFPTETVYGLGANGLDPLAAGRIFEAKKRPANNPLILHVASPDDIDALVSSRPAWTSTLIDNFWAGPLTLVLPRSSVVPDVVTGGGDTVAIRMPSHPVALELIRAAGVPIAAPSANLYQKTSPTNAEHVVAQLEGRIDMLVDDKRTTLGIESTIVDCTGRAPRVLRHGSITIEELRAVLPDTEDCEGVATGDGPQRSPGRAMKHYAPDEQMVVLSGSVPALMDSIRIHLANECTLFVVDELYEMALSSQCVPNAKLGSWHDPARVAANLYYYMQIGSGLQRRIVLTAPTAEGVGRAVHDRLRRAAWRWVDVD